MSNTICPKCGSAEVVPFLFGLPTISALEASAAGSVALGGCVVGGEDPEWLCRSCSLEFGHHDPNSRHGAHYERLCELFGLPLIGAPPPPPPPPVQCSTCMSEVSFSKYCAFCRTDWSDPIAPVREPGSTAEALLAAPPNSTFEIPNETRHAMARRFLETNRPHDGICLVVRQRDWKPDAQSSWKDVPRMVRRKFIQHDSAGRRHVLLVRMR